MGLTRALALCVLVSAALYGAAAGAESPAAPTSDSDIYSVALDGSDLKNLTNTPARSEAYLSRSRDGSRLAYVSEEPPTGSLYVMNMDGANPRRIAPYSPTIDFRQPPVWSPNGRELAYAQGLGCGQVICDQQEVRVAVVDTGQSRRIAAAAVEPTWSPTGRQLAFTKARLSTTGREPSYRMSVVVVQADGRHPRRIVNRAASPAWSPGGRRIAFFGRDRFSYGYQGLFSVRPDGRVRRRLARVIDAAPGIAWSPDRKRVAFGGDFQSRFYVIGADGRGLHAVAKVDGGSDYSWSPDGRRLAWPRGKRIVIANAEGRSRREIAFDKPVLSVVFSADGRRLFFVA